MTQETRVPKARTVWRHFQVFASFALYQVDCPTADKRAARPGSAVFFNARIGGMSQARTKLRTTVSAHSEERVSQTRALHARSWHSRHRVHNQDGRASPRHPAPGRCSLCTRAVTTRQATLRRPRTPCPICRYGQATGSLSAKRHVPNP